MPTSASANSGVPPIAYTSEIALVAAMAPKSNGSSTIGMKKSVVATIACVVVDLVHRGVVAGFDADQQIVWHRTRRALLRDDLLQHRGASLQPQPPPCERLVKRGILVSGAFTGRYLG